jgi:hypothetical protein
MAFRQRSWQTKPYLGVTYMSALICSMLLIVAAKGVSSKSKVNKGQEIGTERYNNAFIIIKATFVLLFAPLIILFMYSVINDPDAPEILKALWKLGKGRLQNLTSSEPKN